MDQEYTGNNCTRYLGKPYLLSNLDELNILADAMGKKLGLLYTNHPINFHRHHNVFNAVCKSIINLAFWDSNLRKQEYIKFNRALRIRVSGKNQDRSKQNNGWLCSTDFQRINSKYISKLEKNIRQKQK